MLLVFAALVGMLFPLVKIAEQTIEPLTLSMLRALLGALLLAAMIAVSGKHSLKSLLAEWKSCAILGLLLSLFFVSISEAEEYITAELGAMLACLLPIATFLMATLLLKWGRFSWLRLSGALLALAGVALFVGPEQVFTEKFELMGMIIISGGYITYAAYLLYARFVSRDPLIGATGTLIFVTG